MTEVRDLATAALLVVGILFFVAGTVGLLRFPDVHTRLHALTKADNLGLGFVTAGVALQSDTLWLAMKLVLVWVLTMAAAAAVAQLIARSALSGRPDEAKGRT